MEGAVVLDRVWFCDCGVRVVFAVGGLFCAEEPFCDDETMVLLFRRSLLLDVEACGVSAGNDDKIPSCRIEPSVMEKNNSSIDRNVSPFRIVQ